MADSTINWTEQDSVLYQRLALVAVPDREEQLATIASLLPFGREQVFRVVEPGSGEGYLSEVILECFPNASVLALDGSEEMRSTASRRLERFRDRFDVQSFDIKDLSWVELARGADAVVSSLCVHHLDDRDKQQMFTALASALNTGGTVIIADLVSARHPVHHHYLASSWDHETKKRSRDQLGSDEGWHAFRDEQWNIYWWPDEMDRPSTLSDQLKWLHEAGFDPSDCFWMKGAHAIYGGYLPRGNPAQDLVGFERALEVSRRVLGLKST